MMDWLPCPLNGREVPALRRGGGMGSEGLRDEGWRGQQITAAIECFVELSAAQAVASYNPVRGEAAKKGSNASFTWCSA